MESVLIGLIFGIAFGVALVLPALIRRKRELRKAAPADSLHPAIRGSAR